MKMKKDEAERSKEQTDNFRYIFNKVFNRSLSKTHVWKAPKDNKYPLSKYKVTEYILGTIFRNEYIIVIYSVTSVT